MDGDAVKDTLLCSYWERWGALMCSVKSSRFGEVETNRGCDRIGVLGHKTNGLSDLVCNRHTVLAFDGVRYGRE